MIDEEILDGKGENKLFISPNLGLIGILVFLQIIGTTFILMHWSFGYEMVIFAVGILLAYLLWCMVIIKYYKGIIPFVILGSIFQFIWIFMKLKTHAKFIIIAVFFFACLFFFFVYPGVNKVKKDSSDLDL